jgi:ATP-dependent Clp protease adaptor protein ClpS
MDGAKIILRSFSSVATTMSVPGMAHSENSGSDTRRALAFAEYLSRDPDEPGGNRPGTPDGHGTSLVVEEASPKLKKPPLFQVVLLNDDYTPMEFVVDVLQRIFGMDRSKATRVMLEVHTKGKGVCGVYTFEIAETKVAQVTAYARQHQHPLLCTMEEA